MAGLQDFIDYYAANPQASNFRADASHPAEGYTASGVPLSFVGEWADESTIPNVQNAYFANAAKSYGFNPSTFDLGSYKKAAFWDSNAGLSLFKMSQGIGNQVAADQAAADSGDGWGDFLKVAAIAAAVYTGGQAMGAWEGFGATSGAELAGATAEGAISIPSASGFSALDYGPIADVPGGFYSALDYGPIANVPGGFPSAASFGPMADVPGGFLTSGSGISSALNTAKSALGLANSVSSSVKPASVAPVKLLQPAGSKALNFGGYMAAPETPQGIPNGSPAPMNITSAPSTGGSISPIGLMIAVVGAMTVIYFSKKG